MMPDRYGDVPDTEVVTEEDAAELAAWQIIHCDLCDDDGRRKGFPCDHVDHETINQRGIALCRQALTEAKKQRETA